jgi:hypothetical protein
MGIPRAARAAAGQLLHVDRAFICVHPRASAVENPGGASFAPEIAFRGPWTTNRAGKPCRTPAMANGRCHRHGGKSTGPTTAEGIARLRAARSVHGFHGENGRAFPYW